MLCYMLIHMAKFVQIQWPSYEEVMPATFIFISHCINIQFRLKLKQVQGADKKAVKYTDKAAYYI